MSIKRENDFDLDSFERKKKRRIENCLFINRIANNDISVRFFDK